MTLTSLIDRAKANSLSYNVITPLSSRTPIPPFNITTNTNPDILFLLNFTTSQRTTLLSSPSTIVLLYTPANEHFGIGPVEGMLCGLPILACDSGGPTESVISHPLDQHTGWLCPPDPGTWADALVEIVLLKEGERAELRERAMRRARELFGMEVMAKGLESALKEAVGMGPVGTPNWILVLWFLLAVLVMVPSLWSTLSSQRA
jgi:alpha-1,3/alpha-1,6-mannosyltransferase